MAVTQPRSTAIYPAVFLTSAGVLMLQVALTRLFSFTLWYHFAYVVISLALLGYGAAGALLSAFPGLLRDNLPRTLFACGMAGALCIPVSLAVYAATPFYPLQLFVEPAQWGYLAAYYAAAGIPFFLAGVCIAGAISAASERVTRVYCADLIGAGVGAGVVVPAIWRLETPGAVILAGGLMACAAACWAWWWRPKVAAAPLALVVVLAVGGGAWWRSLEFRPSVEKSMAFQTAPDAEPGEGGQGSQRYQVWRARQKFRRLPEYTRWGAVFRVDVLEPVEKGGVVASYYTRGASAKLTGPAPDLVRIPHDGDANAMIFDGRDPSRLALFDDHVLALPYLVIPQHPAALALGAGGGTEILCALRHDAKSMTAVELDPITVQLATRAFAEYAGRLHERPGVRFVVGEGRSFVRRSRQQYDLIQINNADSLTAASVGANVLNENYLYTAEAAEEYFRHLTPDGVLNLAHMEPPPGSGDIPFNYTLSRLGGPVEALRRRGVADVRDYFVVIWGNSLMSCLVQPTPFSQEEAKLLERHCAEHGFVPVHLPYRTLHNQLSWFLRTSQETREQFIRSSAIRRDPPTDDSPFIWPYFKWRYLFHPAHRYERMAMTSGQVVMLPLLAVAVLGALAFILAPLAIFRRRGVYSPAAGWLAIYFAALGFGFMFIEISFIQRFVLFLGYPTYSLTVVLSSLLVSSGVGSLVSQRAISRAERSLVWVLVGLLALGVLYLGFGATIFQAFLGYALWARIAVAVLLIAPLGFAMGMFFPTGIRVVNEIAPSFVPWAWGINASTSVVAAILAVMLAMSAGFRMVGIAALGIYVIGVVGLYAARRRARRAA